MNGDILSRLIDLTFLDYLIPYCLYMKKLIALHFILTSIFSVSLIANDELDKMSPEKILAWFQEFRHEDDTYDQVINWRNGSDNIYWLTLIINLLHELRKDAVENQIEERLFEERLRELMRLRISSRQLSEFRFQLPIQVDQQYANLIENLAQERAREERRELMILEFERQERRARQEILQAALRESSEIARRERSEIARRARQEMVRAVLRESSELARLVMGIDLRLNPVSHHATVRRDRED